MLIAPLLIFVLVTFIAARAVIEGDLTLGMMLAIFFIIGALLIVDDTNSLLGALHPFNGFFEDCSVIWH